MATRVPEDELIDLHVRLKRGLHARLGELAQREDRSLNQTLNQIVERGLNDKTRPPCCWCKALIVRIDLSHLYIGDDEFLEALSA